MHFLYIMSCSKFCLIAKYQISMQRFHTFWDFYGSFLGSIFSALGQHLVRNDNWVAIFPGIGHWLVYIRQVVRQSSLIAGLASRFITSPGLYTQIHLQLESPNNWRWKGKVNNYFQTQIHIFKNSPFIQCFIRSKICISKQLKCPFFETITKFQIPCMGTATGIEIFNLSKFLSTLMKAGWDCISQLQVSLQLYFGSVFLSCISLLYFGYFGSVFLSCISGGVQFMCNFDAGGKRGVGQ